MSTAALRVKFPTTWPGWHIPEFVLYEANPSSPSVSSSNGSSCADSDESDIGGQPLIIVSVDEETSTDYGSDSPVFSATMKGNWSKPRDGIISSSAERRIVLKFAMREDLVPDLVEEAAMYDASLRSLQGRVIPKCYGLYEGQGEEGQLIACLILERWGECVDRPFWMLAVDLRLRILDQLHDIHRCGYWHNDFAERNVLLSKPVGDGCDTNDAILDVRIIDLSEIMPHTCELVKGVQGFSEEWSPTPTYSDNDGKKVDWRVGKPAPDVDDFGCGLLWKVWDECVEICRALPP
ncbi:hypothetical protein PLEOSDRAFT_165859 [Pleurotus ostreatus PC15]|uniref:Uncharacterized protein n=1 Tax=Pleurotus ostreatus (strain PC15) TaxID=1137138 RepID=A0A067P1M1_PLEO1|nr:hypothetical protein PLEOSDRAFT_165859 [Pleurotus ostreatus PC15]